MSKSYKKTPYLSNNSSGMKQIANRKIRNYKEDIPKGNSFKKIFCSYDICDYTHCWTREGFRLDMERHIKDYIANGGNNNCWWLRDRDLEEDLSNVRTYADTEKFVDYNRWRRYYKGK